MKKVMILAASVASVIALPVPSAAADVPTQAKQELTAVGAITVGALAGGPPGAIAGMVAGAWLAGELGRAGELEATAAQLVGARGELDMASERVASLERELGMAQAEQRRLAKSLLASLEVALMFRTGESVLSDGGRSQLASLARYLRQHEDLRIQVSGYADPRGDDAANMALSRARAEAVADALVAQGVPRDRLLVDAYGEQHVVSAQGDPDAWAMERRVVISLEREQGLALTPARAP